jgi:cytochrome b involved in lipid metabolism
MSVFYTSFRESFHAHSRMDNELPFYTKKEVATHNTPEDLWVLVNGKVYDLTQFHHRHPGGPGGKFVILPGCQS